MAPYLEQKGRVNMMEVPASKENGSAQRQRADNHITCASNYEYDISEMEEISSPEGAHNVPMVDCEPEDLDTTESDDATENSSSFGNTASGDESDSMLSDGEVVSQLCGEAESFMGIEGSVEVFRMRKQKLTPHWKAYIQPYTWRYKWVELQIRRLRSQARKYDLQLAKINQRKQQRLADLKVEEFGSKSVIFPIHAQRKKVMKRNIRKPVEGTIDKAAYMANHNLFSSFGSRRPDVPYIDSVRDNLGGLPQKKVDDSSLFEVSDILESLGSRDGDSMEQILWKIRVAELNVNKLKERLNKVTSENAELISSANLSLLEHSNEGSARNHASPNNGDTALVGSSYVSSQLMPDNNMGDLVIPESAVSSHGEVTQLPDITESTDRPPSGNESKNSGDECMMYNCAEKEEENNFYEVKIQPAEDLMGAVDEEQEVLVEQDVNTDDQPSQMTSSRFKVKYTRRGRRRTSRWRR